MPILVSDANIFIDFDTAGLTPALFKLPHEFLTSNIIYNQELQLRHAELPGLGLRILDLGGPDIELLEVLVERYPKPGVNDLSVLVIAMQRKWALVSGDKNRREVAQLEGIQIYGTLWLMDQMITHRIINLVQARDAFDTMRQSGRRLPWRDVRAMLVNKVE